jgi:hypothetical protein
MSSDQGHGVKVETDSILAALAPTRALRQALDVLWGGLPIKVETPAICEAFHAIDDHIRTTELQDLRRGVLARDYFIISPINPMNPPSPEDMEKVAAALRTLDDLGLIIIL